MPFDSGEMLLDQGTPAKGYYRNGQRYNSLADMMADVPPLSPEQKQVLMPARTVTAGPIAQALMGSPAASGAPEGEASVAGMAPLVADAARQFQGLGQQGLAMARSDTGVPLAPLPKEALQPASSLTIQSPASTGKFDFNAAGQSMGGGKVTPNQWVGGGANDPLTNPDAAFRQRFEKMLMSVAPNAPALMPNADIDPMAAALNRQSMQMQLAQGQAAPQVLQSLFHNEQAGGRLGLDQQKALLDNLIGQGELGVKQGQLELNKKIFEETKAEEGQLDNLRRTMAAQGATAAQIANAEAQYIAAKKAKSVTPTQTNNPPGNPQVAGTLSPELALQQQLGDAGLAIASKFQGLMPNKEATDTERAAKMDPAKFLATISAEQPPGFVQQNMGPIGQYLAAKYGGKEGLKGHVTPGFLGKLVALQGAGQLTSPVNTQQMPLGELSRHIFGMEPSAEDKAASAIRAWLGLEAR